MASVERLVLLSRASTPDDSTNTALGNPSKNRVSAYRFALLALGRAGTLPGRRENSKREKCL